MRRAVLAAFAAVLSISATAQSADQRRPVSQEYQRAIRKEFDEMLKDGATARYQFDFIFNDIEVCGKVNAKNSYGAYVGWTPFFASVRHGKVLTIIMDSEGSKARDHCLELMLR